MRSSRLRRALVRDKYQTVLLALMAACVLGVIFCTWRILQPAGLPVTLKPGTFGQVVGFTDEETARTFETTMRGYLISLDVGVPFKVSPAEFVEIFVTAMHPCAVRLEPGTKARLLRHSEVESAVWCRISEGEHEGDTLLIPILEIDHEDLRGLRAPEAAPQERLGTSVVFTTLGTIEQTSKMFHSDFFCKPLEK